MKDIPLIFPLALLIIIGTLVFSTAYGLADSTIREKGDSQAQYEWDEKAALWVCPFH
tara:strand:+ start:2542 stop:2712 length:171 start_codon:yes stop_codon:yes gene_type:complete